MFLDAFVPLQQRFIDVGLGGPDSFSFNVKSNVSWLTLTPSSGAVSAQSPEQRVEVSVDWSKIEGTQYAVINFNATVTGASGQVTQVFFVANHTVVPSDFKGT